MPTTVFWFLLENATNLFESYLVYAFLSVFLQKRYSQKWRYLLYIVINTLLLSVASYYISNVIIKMLLIFFVDIMLSLIFYQGRLLQMILLVISVTAIFAISESFILMLLNLFFHNFYVAMMTPSLERMWFMLLTETLRFIILRCIQHWAPNTGQQVRIKYGFPLLLVPSISILIGFVLFYYASSHSTIFFLLPLISILSLLITNFMVFYQHHKLHQEAQTQQRESLLQQYIYSETDRMAKINQQQMELRRSLHDVKNQLIPVIQALDEQDQVTAKEHLLSIVAKLPQVKLLTITNNPVINAILSIKISQGESFAIKMDVQSNMPADCSIEAADISVMLGNSLDNAIETTLKVEAGDRRQIFVLLHYDRGILCLKVKNPLSQPVIVQNHLCPTTKSNPQNHGFGLESIHRLAQKYNGFAEINTQNNEFNLTVMLLAP